jgi:hypothetical protein
VHAPLTRVVVFANTLATLLYSRHLKPVPVVKNVVCASVIATTVLLGGATVKGSFAAGFSNVWPMMLLVGAAIGHREMLMDVQDVDNDRRAAVQAVPVLVGAKPALALSCVPLMGLLAMSVVAQTGFPRLAASGECDARARRARWRQQPWNGRWSSEAYVRDRVRACLPAARTHRCSARVMWPCCSHPSPQSQPESSSI